MAATRLISIRGSKSQSVIKSLTERTDYVKNPEKTENGSLVYAYGCTPQLVAAEFMLSKRQYTLPQGSGRDCVPHTSILQAWGDNAGGSESRGPRAGRTLSQGQTRLHRLHTRGQKAHPLTHNFQLHHPRRHGEIPQLPWLRARDWAVV